MTIATFGGKPLLNSSPVSWPLLAGVKPAIQTFDVTPDDARALGQSNGPYQLVIDTGHGNPVVVDKLYLLNVSPGEDKFISRIQVADRRCWWGYGQTGQMWFNHRRNVGTKRLVANNQIPAVNPTAFKVSYWNWSLNNGQVWVTRTMLEAVLKKAQQAEASMNGLRFPYVIDERVGDQIRALPIEDFTLDEACDQGLMRAMAYLPAGSIYVDYDGTVVVTSQATGDEKGVVKALSPEIAGAGHTDLVFNNLIRPRAIEVLYTREVELVFDFHESALDVGQTTTDIGDTRAMENVLPSVDYQLTTANGVPDSQAPIAQGTWITFPQAFNYWGNMPFISQNGDGRKLDHDILQRAFVPGMDLEGALLRAGSQPQNNGQIKPWVARIRAAMDHYRTTFRIAPKYMDRILSIRAYRVTTIDPQSGTRAPAPAYGDYSWLYTQQTLLKQVRSASTQDGSPDWIINRTAYPQSGVLDETAEVSPCKVEVVDQDQGIIHLTYMPNPIYGMNETVLPSQMAVGMMPTADITNRSRPISFDTVIGSLVCPKLDSEFKLKVLLSCVPAASNDNQGQLHKITVYPNDIASMVPNPLTAGLSLAQGPVMQVRIGPQTEVARVAWNDARSAELDRCFGIGAGEPNLEGLVINEGAPSDLTNGASLNAIAKASAARIYAALADRFQGSMAGYMNGKVRPGGWLTEVRHTLQPDGVAMTTVTMPVEVPQWSIFSFLDSASRTAILKLVQPQ
jgi:hypothetical protein